MQDAVQQDAQRSTIWDWGLPTKPCVAGRWSILGDEGIAAGGGYSYNAVGVNLSATFPSSNCR